MHLKAQFIAGLALAAMAAVAPADTGTGAPNMRIIDRIAAGGEGGWDYVSVDQTARKLYITRGTSIMSVDADTGKVNLLLALTNPYHSDVVRVGLEK